MPAAWQLISHDKERSELLDRTSPTWLGTDIGHDSAADESPDEPEKPKYPNAVDIEAPDDPENPVN
ncbi:hypothetical protein EYZ11_003471 [Aspergillus tanneri]|uniref:Uncharacterized protein n=1 Tax=Aspergillus tanneri TaxID=1220188 RepID=A0A4S3JQB7_9EURO|nr:hypothetical protein EYZ11_003471 [Aspergillus tanneri]